MSFGVAIIGGGIFAREEHLPAVRASKHLTLKAVYSRSLKSAKTLETGSDVDLYSDDSGSGKTYHDLLLRSDIHAVIIALPITKQPEFIEAALLAGKHVLSEKPIANTIKDAEHLIKFYDTKIDKSKITWGVAENFRFLDAYGYARQEIEKLGRILNFRVKMFTFVDGGKWYETEWRKVPSHQGGFLLDGGVHFTAGIRRLLGSADAPKALSAYTSLLQKHLPPVDTVNSIWITKTGISGTFSVSFGTTLGGSEWTVACEKGSVTVSGGKVTVREGVESDNKFTEKEFPNDGTGVTQEVVAWGESLAAGKPNPLQSPEEALADLELLEKMLRSGEGHGKTESLQFQL